MFKVNYFSVLFFINFNAKFACGDFIITVQHVLGVP